MRAGPGGAFALVSGRWEGVFWLLALTVVQAAAVSSLGLAVATWVRHPGRAVVATMLVFALMTAVWPLAIWSTGLARNIGPYINERLLLGSPFFAAEFTTTHAGLFGRRWWNWGYGSDGWIGSEPGWPLAWVVLYGLGAGLLLYATLSTFDRCLGRATDPRGTRADR